MDKKRWVIILASSFVAWWFLGRKKSTPAVENQPNVAPVFVPPPGEVVTNTRQPDPSSGTAQLVYKQNAMLRQFPTVLAIRPEPILMKVADFQADLQSAFRRQTASITGSLSSRSGSQTPDASASFTTNNSVRKPGTVAVA